MGIRKSRPSTRALALSAMLVVALTGSLPSSQAAKGGKSQVAKGGEKNHRQDWIVVLHDDGADPESVAAEHARAHGAKINHVYKHAVKGYAATFEGPGASEVARDRRVAHVERDQEVRLVTTQNPAPSWGLDRIDQRTLPLAGGFTYTRTGAGVTAYVIDTGIRYTHTDFDGLSPNRAVKGIDAVTPNGSASDCNGHGTHVAGTVGGTRYGVAKAVKLVSVRVLGCTGSGTVSGVMMGIDWVTADHDPGERAVANMSLGGGASAALDTAVRNSINDGVSYAIAAGNGNLLGMAQNACNSSPARVSAAMTISATTIGDAKASFANYGPCVDWFAPGVNIRSASSSSDTATAVLSGTSMATPHTTGVAALYLQTAGNTSPSAVRTALYGLTTKGKVTSSSTTNNHLLYTNL
jgi:subtilisin family serine protease